MTGQEARDDEREVRAIFEALADRLGEHPHSRNHEQGMSGEYETFIHETNVEALAEWLMPTVLDALSRKHPEPEITEAMVERGARAFWTEIDPEPVIDPEDYPAMRKALEAALRVPVGEGEQAE